MTKMNAQNLLVGWHKSVIARLDAIELNSGEIVVLAGPNGAGKSTTIKTLGRQLKPLSGSIKIDGMDIEQLDARAFARQVAYVPQLIELPPKMTVEHLVALGRNPHQMWWSWEAGKEDQTSIESAIEQTDLCTLRKHPLSNLSGGERQRAAIAVALAQQSRFILLDEPTAHLDFKYQLQLMEILKSLKSSGLGLMVVLHDLNLTAQLADRVILLGKTGNSQPGFIVKAGTAEECLNPETLRQVYHVEVSVLRDLKSDLISYMPTRLI